MQGLHVVSQTAKCCCKSLLVSQDQLLYHLAQLLKYTVFAMLRCGGSSQIVPGTADGLRCPDLSRAHLQQDCQTVACPLAQQAIGLLNLHELCTQAAAAT